MTRPSRPGRVLYLVTSSGVGGAERQVHDLAAEFSARGWAVAVVSMLPVEPMLASLQESGVSVTSLGMRKGVPDPRAVVALARLVRRWKPDVLHGHMVHANLLARISRPLAWTPILISTMHNQDEGSQWRYRAYRLTDRLGTLTTTVSELAMREAIRRHAAPAGRIRLIPNGVDLAAYRPSPEVRASTRASMGLRDEFLWLSVGRLTAAKAHGDLLTAFEQLVTGRPGSRLFIAGTGELQDDLQRQIDAAGLGERVTLLGLRADVPALMQAADGFVLSSLWEGLPMVLLEAAASGLPIVATDVGGSQDTILPDVSGLLVPASAPARLCEAMGKVMDLLPGERETMAQAGRRHAEEHFALDRVADTWEQLYRAGP